MSEKTEKALRKEDIEKEMGVLITSDEFEFLLEHHAGENAMGKLQILTNYRDAYIRKQEAYTAHIVENLSVFIQKLTGR